jgi:hypothetical protein
MGVIKGPRYNIPFTTVRVNEWLIRPLACVHCGLYSEEHLDKTRCLFSPTEYLSRFQHRRNQQNSRHDGTPKP